MFDFFSDPKAAAQVDFLIRNIPFAVWETLYSTVIASVFAYLIGLPLGVVLSLAGGPFFIWLLLKQRRGGGGL